MIQVCKFAILLKNNKFQSRSLHNHKLFSKSRSIYIFHFVTLICTLKGERIIFTLLISSVCLCDRFQPSWSACQHCWGASTTSRMTGRDASHTVPQPHRPSQLLTLTQTRSLTLTGRFSPPHLPASATRNYFRPCWSLRASVSNCVRTWRLSGDN